MKKGWSWFGRCLAWMALLGLGVSCAGTDTDMKRLTIEPGKVPDVCPEIAGCNDQNTFFKVAWLGVNSMEEPYRLDGWATHVLPVPDGYLVLGNKISMETDYQSGNASLVGMKIGRDGAIAWQREYAPAFFFNILIGAAEDRGGAVLAVTEMMPDDDVPTQDDILLARLDADGDIAWQKILGGRERNEAASTVRKTRDGDFLVAGNAYVEYADGEISDALLVRVGGDGAVREQRLVHSQVPGYPAFYGTDAVETPDGGAILVGALYDQTDPVAVLKLDGQGNLVWQRAISDGAQGRVYVDVAAGGSVVVVSDYFFEGEDGSVSWGLLLNLLGPDGSLVWQRLVAPNAKQYSLVPREVRVGPDGGIYVVATGWSHNAPDWTTKIHLFVFGDGGNLVWQRRYGLSPILAQERKQAEERMASLYAADLEFDADGGILIAGGIRMDAWDIKRGGGTNAVGMMLLKAGPDGRLPEGCPLEDGTELPVEVVEYLPADVEMQLFDAGLPIRESRLVSGPGPFDDPEALCGLTLPGGGE